MLCCAVLGNTGQPTMFESNRGRRDSNNKTFPVGSATSHLIIFQCGVLREDVPLHVRLVLF
eukprot:9467686-Pyramimonas_sp.AAC.1